MATLLHPSMFLQDDIWISRKEKLSRLISNTFSEIEIDDSDRYSTVEEVDTTDFSSDQHQTNTVKPKPSSKKHKRIHFQDQVDEAPPEHNKSVQRKPLPATTNRNVDIKSIRSAIDSLRDDESVRNPSTYQQQVQVYLHNPGEFDEQQDSFPADFTNLMRMASQSTKKMLRKIKVSEISPKKLWKRSHTQVTEAGSTESLSSPGPSGHYHLPRDMSPVSNNSPVASAGSGDMDTPFNNGHVVTRTVENLLRENENQEGHGLFRRKASGALKYMQKWKVASRVGGLIPRSTTRTGDADMNDTETAWNSTSDDRSASREESVRKRLARSLSF